MNAFGYRVSPAEVEAAIATHPDVAEVGVREVVAGNGLAIIAAFVRPAGEARDAEALLAHARTHLADYKMPREIRFLDALPHTANGKLARRMLPDRL